jgi:hypothetical protein
MSKDFNGTFGITVFAQQNETAFANRAKSFLHTFRHSSMADDFVHRSNSKITNLVIYPMESIPEFGGSKQ